MTVTHPVKMTTAEAQAKTVFYLSKLQHIRKKLNKIPRNIFDIR